MRILVLNCGSSSVKFQFIDMDGEEVLARGLVEKIGSTLGEAQDLESCTAQELLDHRLTTVYMLEPHELGPKLGAKLESRDLDDYIPDGYQLQGPTLSRH